jgi:DNA-binding NarL/FixJ family response regulator
MGGVVVTEPGLSLDAEETELVRLLAEGLVLEAIARRLAVSERTVRRRIRTLCDRFQVDTPVQVVVIAARSGVL